MSIRRPAVAGTFYPAEEKSLRRAIADLLPPGMERSPALGVLVPHAGYEYSGAVAGAVFARVEVSPEVVILAFNHRMQGPPVAVWAEGGWRTPLGEAAIATDLVDRIRAALPRAEVDESTFRGEHSAEVQIPFLQFVRPDVRIAPVFLNTQDRALLREAACALAGVTKGVLVVATTDLTHCGAGYGIWPPPPKKPREWAREQDALVLNKIHALDVDGFWNVVLERNVTMCGAAPTAALIEYALCRGATSAEVVKYATSADDEADADRAVGYPGVVVPCPLSPA